MNTEMSIIGLLESGRVLTQLLVLEMWSDEEHFYLNRLLTRLNPPTDNDVLSGYDVTIVRKQSDFQLFRFIVEIIKTETGRDLQVLQHQGSYSGNRG